jgi:dTDP-4-dehydrorhamnose reductase
MVMARCPAHYVFRLPILFGACSGKGQFVEKMLARLFAGDGKIRVAADVISSPSYSRDIARKVRELLEHGAPFGTYHLANEGTASLYELMKTLVDLLGLDAAVEQGSYRDFPFVGRKNLRTPLRSVRTEPLRPWREAARDYCLALRRKGGSIG